MKKEELQNLRQEYTKAELDISNVDSQPFIQFNKWFKEALSSELIEPNAMTVASVDAEGKPSCRIVLLKGVDHGFVFYTNYLSRKGHALSENPNACINFFWQELERQVRIEGVVEKVSDEESDAYFDSRPYGSRLGAIASPQSTKIVDRAVIENNLKNFESKYATDKITRPKHWGGFRLKPSYFEFWQGRANRLHDRICYELVDGSWNIYRIAP